MSFSEIVLSVVALCAIALVVFGVRALRLLSQTRGLTDVTVDTTELIRQLDAAAKHYADVSAVVAMVRNLDADPDAVVLMKSYPETVQAAAWLHYINGLGAALQKARDELMRCHGAYGASAHYTADAQRNVNAIRSKLDTAIVASGQTGLRSV